jgi:hypothetical protein
MEYFPWNSKKCNYYFNHMKTVTMYSCINVLDESLILQKQQYWLEISKQIQNPAKL